MMLFDIGDFLFFAGNHLGCSILESFKEKRLFTAFPINSVLELGISENAEQYIRLQ
jgi:hypothetical protein